MVKIEDPSMPMQSGQRRPISSEPGAQISGPEAKPRTKRLVPSAVTSFPTSNSFLAPTAPAAKMALLNDATNVAQHAAVDM